MDIIDFSRFKMVAFDMDGTLIDSWPIMDWAEQEVRRQFGVSQGTQPLHVEWEEYISKFPRGETDGMVGFTKYRLEKWGFDPEDAWKYNGEWQRLVHEKLSTEARYKDGAGEFMLALKKRGIKIALVTSAPRVAVNILDKNPNFNSANLVSIMDTIVTGDNVDAKKPSPEAYQLAMKRMGVTPDETLVFEDSYTGAMGAVNAGIKNIVIITDDASEHERARLLELSPWHFVDFMALLAQAKP